MLGMLHEGTLQRRFHWWPHSTERFCLTNSTNRSAPTRFELLHAVIDACAAHSSPFFTCFVFRRPGPLCRIVFAGRLVHSAVHCQAVADQPPFVFKRRSNGAPGCVNKISFQCHAAGLLTARWERCLSLQLQVWSTSREWPLRGRRTRIAEYSQVEL